MVLGGVVYTAVPFYKRARKIEGMFKPIALLVAGCRIADGDWGLGGRSSGLVVRQGRTQYRDMGVHLYTQ
jgi:hypothetical protein